MGSQVDSYMNHALKIGNIDALVSHFPLRNLKFFFSNLSFFKPVIWDSPISPLDFERNIISIQIVHWFAALQCEVLSLALHMSNNSKCCGTAPAN